MRYPANWQLYMYMLGTASEPVIYYRPHVRVWTKEGLCTERTFLAMSAALQYMLQISHTRLACCLQVGTSSEKTGTVHSCYSVIDMGAKVDPNTKAGACLPTKSSLESQFQCIACESEL